MSNVDKSVIWDFGKPDIGSGSRIFFLFCGLGMALSLLLKMYLTDSGWVLLVLGVLMVPCLATVHWSVFRKQSKILRIRFEPEKILITEACTQHLFSRFFEKQIAIDWSSVSDIRAAEISSGEMTTAGVRIELRPQVTLSTRRLEYGVLSNDHAEKTCDLLERMRQIALGNQPTDTVGNA